MRNILFVLVLLVGVKSGGRDGCCGHCSELPVSAARATSGATVAVATAILMSAVAA